jgi:hypothetical protein
VTFHLDFPAQMGVQIRYIVAFLFLRVTSSPNAGWKLDERPK